ncbi:MULTISPECIES: TIGR04086 family membrane protein [Paenibacillus]|uniref:TIGR04086 family membrane protein n=1 Tax=Paenibacillus radicis (ex Xue et al. 2023) TaxID=2972489 RepID=A0ABT1YLL8_9BACL|nr:TIGR04086 family membrane protein [Paenibacillus radicis (ex Xue et al. 2023)]MCR8634081.1 TIGR04086 family membrane protein [Paenibacillus radicis (ex Xue et al. 2023)]
MKQSPIFSGLMYAMIFMLLGTLMTSLLMLTTNLQENSLFSYTMSVHGVAMFVGGLVSGKRSGSKGWYNGGLLGLVYTLIVWIIGFLAYDAGLSWQTLYLLGLSFMAGSLGGMIGVNLKK